MSDPHSLWAELKQRKVVRSAGFYIVVAWGAVTVTRELTEILELGAWLPKLVLLLAISGLPLVLVLAWAFELKRGRVRRAAPTAGDRLWGTQVILLAILASGPVLGAGWWWLSTDGGTHAEGDALRIAVLPFSVQGSDEFAYLGHGMADLLSTKLDGAGGLMTADPRAVVRQIGDEAATVDPEHAAEVAAGLGAGWFVLGSVVEAAGRLQVSADIFERAEPGQAVGHGRVEGPAEELFELVDRVAAALLIGVSGGPEAQVQRVAGVTTSSLPAFKAYMDGERAYRTGQYAAALGHFERAVAIDSTFALAYYRISTAAEWAWVEQQIYAGADRAVALADRLPARERRLVEVLGVRRREANEAAEDVLRSFLGAYPDDVEAWANLGELVTHTRPMHGRSSLEGRQVWERVLALNPAHPGALLHTMRFDAYEGQLDDMDARLRTFHELVPQADRSIEMDVLAVAAHGEPTAEADILETLASASDIDRAIGVWNASVYAGNLDLAVKICELMAEPGQSPELRRAGLLWLASLEYARGRWEAAQSALDALGAFDELAAAEYRAVLLTLPLSPATADELADAFEDLHAQPVPEGRGGPQFIIDVHDGLHEMIRAYGLALLSVERGDIPLAAAYADSLEAMSLPADEEHVSQDLALGIRARIRLVEGDAGSAVELLQQMRMSAWHGQSLFSPFYARTAERFLRGEALHRIGRSDEAVSWLAHVAENSPFEVAFLPASTLALADIQASQGATEEAAGLYGRFLDLWQGADTAFASITEDAENKLSELRND